MVTEINPYKSDAAVTPTTAYLPVVHAWIVGLLVSSLLVRAFPTAHAVVLTLLGGAVSGTLAQLYVWLRRTTLS